jgi:putative ABC transport system permease protein
MIPALFGKTYLKTILREIRGSLGRFAAIFGIAALGVGFLAGLLAVTPDMKLSVDRYFDRADMMDIFIKADAGFTEEDLRAAAALPETALVQGARVTDAPVQTASDEIILSRIFGLPPDRPGPGEGGAYGFGAAGGAGFVNRLELIAGRLPEGADECLVQAEGGFLTAPPLGSVLRILPESRGPPREETYRITRFTVTGIVKSPLYISFEREPSAAGNGRLGAVIYVRDEAYALPVYTDLYLTLRGAAALTAFSPDYQALVDAGAEKLEALGLVRSEVRREEILAEARRVIRERLAAAEGEYAAGREAALGELAAARARLDAGAAELSAAEEALAAAEAEAAAGRERLAAERLKAEGELAENEERLRAGAEALEAARRSLAEAKARLEENRGEVEKTRASRFRMASARAREGVAQYDQGLRDWEAGAALVEEKEAELREGRRLLAEGRERAAGEFSAAEEALAAGEAEIAGGRRRLEEARQELARGEAAYRSGRARAEAELQEGAAELARGRQSAEEGALGIEKPQWYVLDRKANVGAATYGVNAEKINDVAKVFPVFFLLVAALVALTTMTRMVEEERAQIGALKALGYRKRVIAAKYLIYCGLTAVLGSAAGMAAGFRGLPRIIYSAFGTRYHLPPLVTRFNLSFGLIACAAVLLCTMGATLSACYRSLREKPAALMLPRSPRAGKRIFLEYIPLIWRPMKFTYKVTARNLLRYKKHFFMTVTGIAGCTALMVAGFGLRNSVADIARTHFAEILRYDLRIELREGAEPDAALRAFLAEAGGYAAIHVESATLINKAARDGGGERVPVILHSPRKGDTLEDYINLRNRKTGQALPLGGPSAVLSEKLAAMLDIQTGETFTLENAGGTAGVFTLTGITENYVGSNVYLDGEAYAAAFGADPEYSTLLLRTGIKDPADQDQALTRVLAGESAAGAEFTSHAQESYNRLLSSIGFVVLVLVFAAGALAMIVLYNLTNININERSRELATLRVLGFHHQEAAAYIFRETGVLSCIGAAAGLVLGIPLHRFIITVAENPDLMFGRRIAPASFILSALSTLIFSALVDMLMLGKIRRIKMAESMKALD